MSMSRTTRCCRCRCSHQKHRTFVSCTPAASRLAHTCGDRLPVTSSGGRVPALELCLVCQRQSVRYADSSPSPPAAQLAAASSRGAAPAPAPSASAAVLVRVPLCASAEMAETIPRNKESGVTTRNNTARGSLLAQFCCSVRWRSASRAWRPSSSSRLSGPAAALLNIPHADPVWRKT